MKYALLVDQAPEYFDRRDDAAAMAAGKADREALQAAGVFVGGAGPQSPQAATTVWSAKANGKFTMDQAETKEFLAGSALLRCQTWMTHWNGPPAIPPPPTPRLKSVHCLGRAFWSERPKVHSERIRNACSD